MRTTVCWKKGRSFNKRAASDNENADKSRIVSINRQKKKLISRINKIPSRGGIECPVFIQSVSIVDTDLFNDADGLMIQIDFLRQRRMKIFKNVSTHRLKRNASGLRIGMFSDGGGIENRASDFVQRF